MYSKLREEPVDLMVKSVTYKKLSSTETYDIIKEVNKARSEYKNKR